MTARFAIPAPITVSARRRGALVLIAVLALVCGCGGPADEPAATVSAPSVAVSGPAQSTSLSDLTDKLTSIAKDECETHPAGEIYPQCARFAREVQNATVAARAATAGRPEQAAVTTAGDEIDAALNQLTRDGCLLAPEQGASASAQVCGPDLARLQSALRQLRTALGTPS